jgi:hypothetical protein
MWYFFSPAVFSMRARSHWLLSHTWSWMRDLDRLQGDVVVVVVLVVMMMLWVGA